MRAYVKVETETMHRLIQIKKMMIINTSGIKKIMEPNYNRNSSLL